MIILGGGIYASGIAGLSFLKKHINQLKEKKVILFCDGAAPFDEIEFQNVIDYNLKDSLAGLPCFYCRGALDLSALNFVDRNLCKILLKAAEKKKPEDCSILERALLEAKDQKCDWTDKSYLAPILEEIRK